jgi:hypothetical protein
MSSPLENINNSVLKGRSAMPQKAPTSINENKFSMNRVLYSKTIASVMSETADILKGKQFYGPRNRDASSVLQRRNILVGGNRNESGKSISFQGTKDTNDVRQAKKRVRSSGSAVPAKKTHNYLNSPIFY